MAIKKIKIAGCLETPATGNIVTTAYSVEDEAWDGSTLNDRRQTTINRRLNERIDTLLNEINDIPILDLSELEAAVLNHTSQITQINQTNRNQDALINNKVDTEVYSTGQAQQDANIDRLSGNVNTLENLTRINLEGDVGVIVDFDNVVPENPNVTTGNAIAQVLLAVLDNNSSPNTEYKASKWLLALLDSANKFLAGVDTYGDLEWKYNKVGLKSSKGWIRAILDSNNKVLQGTLSDGTFWAPNVETKYFHSDGMIQAVVDHEGKILGYRDTNGAWHEKNLIVENLTVNGDSFNPGNTSTVVGGYTKDWSREDTVIIPEPKGVSVVKITIPEYYYSTYEYQLAIQYYGTSANGLVKHGLAYSKVLDWGAATYVNDKGKTKETFDSEHTVYLEFADALGNYFKKPIRINAQGNATLIYDIISQSIKFLDGSKITFGNWVSQKSFHLKKFYQDIFKGQSIVGNRLLEEFYLSRPSDDLRPWSYTIYNDSTANGLGKIKKDFNTGALGHSDGFPIKLYLNGEYLGLYAWCLKKHEDNYYMDNDKANNIFINGIPAGNKFWNGLNNLNSGDRTEVWNKLEVRLPEELSNTEGTVYDFDLLPNGHKELSDNGLSGQVKDKVTRLSNAVLTIDALYNSNNVASSILAMKDKFSEYFNLDFLVDYTIFTQVVYHREGLDAHWEWCTWDGNIWSPMVWDLDAIFGIHSLGYAVYQKSTYEILESSWGGRYPYGPDKYVLKAKSNVKGSGMFWEQTKARYKELRDLGIICADRITDKMEEWVQNIGYKEIKEEYDFHKDIASYRDALVNTEYWERIVKADKNESINPVYYYDSTNGGRYISKYNASDIITQVPKDTIVTYTDEWGMLMYKAKKLVPQDLLAPCGLYENEIRPKEGGVFNSIPRIKNWLVERLQALDEYFEYNNN